MQIILTERCSNCGARVRIYNRKNTQYFGPQIRECPKCKHLFLDKNAIELSTKSEECVKDYCKDYVIFSHFFLCLVIFVIVISVAAIVKSEEWVNQTENFIFLLLMGYGVPFFAKCIVRYFYFWKKIYRESDERMSDEGYLKKAELYNKMYDE